MVYHQIDPYYLSLLDRKCMGDYPVVDLIINRTKTIFYPMKYSYIPPRQLDDIHVQTVTHGMAGLGPADGMPVTATIPSWLYLKHEIIPDLIRQLRLCYRHREAYKCHGTLNDHVNLLMKTIWGPSSIVPHTREYASYQPIREIVARHLREEKDFFTPGIETLLMKLVLRHDVMITARRKKWRDENPDAVLRSIREDGGTGHVTDQATKLLDPEKNAESRKRSAEEVLYRLGWEKERNDWEDVFPKMNKILETQIAEVKGRQRDIRAKESEKEEERKEDGDVELVHESPQVRSVPKRLEPPPPPPSPPIVNAPSQIDEPKDAKAKKEEKGRSVTKRIGGGILRFMKIKK
ncbi:hypothetical protein TWF718_009327 [Orbilia javanica]|uniref:Uncharacterized protein n=1 Tax=Orbilia javanica TaxID=47235 RepID=A0AAN8RME8_9PEZI